MCLHPHSTADPQAIRRAVAEALEGRPLTLEDGAVDRRLWRGHPLLRAHCARVAVADADLIQLPPAAWLPQDGRRGGEGAEEEEEEEEEEEAGAAAAAGSGAAAAAAAAHAAAATASASAAAARQQQQERPRPGQRRPRQQQLQPPPPPRLAPGLTREHFFPGCRLQSWQYRPRVCVYACAEDDAYAEDDDDDGGGNGGVPSYKELALPSAQTQGLWESLHFGDGGALKRRLLRYASSALLFSEAGVDGSMVAWNRVVLLHGPPGTGKTTFCRALAHKLAARLAAAPNTTNGGGGGAGGAAAAAAARYPAGAALVEVCAHSLFSKWFSESGKLVSRLFAKIDELAADGDALVFVLVDEVESLAAARRPAGGAGSAEPSDAVRAVNALLTGLDALRRRPNVLVLATSNLTEAVDVAFVDRADIKAYVGPPAVGARYGILRSAVLELLRAGIVAPDDGGGGAGAGGPRGGAEEGGDDDDDDDDDDDGLPSEAPPLLTHEQLERAARQQAGSGGGGGGVHALAAAALGAAAAAVGAAAAGGHAPCYDARLAASAALALAAEAAEGLSGRALRKLPFLAHAGAGGRGEALPSPCGLLAFCGALRRAALRERSERRQLRGHQGK